MVPLYSNNIVIQESAFTSRWTSIQNTIRVKVRCWNAEVAGWYAVFMMQTNMKWIIMLLSKEWIILPFCNLTYKLPKCFGIIYNKCPKQMINIINSFEVVEISKKINIFKSLDLIYTFRLFSKSLKVSFPFRPTVHSLVSHCIQMLFAYNLLYIVILLLALLLFIFWSFMRVTLTHTSTYINKYMNFMTLSFLWRRFSCSYLNFWNMCLMMLLLLMHLLTTTLKLFPHMARGCLFFVM